MRLRILLISVAALLFSAAANAEEGSGKTNIKYGYPMALELQGGFTGLPFTVKGEKTRAMGLSTGGDFTIRFSYFMHKHWGLFASGSVDEVACGAERYFGTVNKADGDKYRYSNGSYMNLLSNSLVLGAVYRYDFGQCSLRPRLGVGVANYQLRDHSYYRTPRNDDSALPELFRYTVTAPQKDYLPVNGQNWVTYGVGLATYAGCQLCYTIRRHFFFAVELGLKSVFPVGLTYSSSAYKAYQAYNPSNWTEAVVTYNERDSYNFEEDAFLKVNQTLPRFMFNFNIGIGWNIGWNRNYKK